MTRIEAGLKAIILIGTLLLYPAMIAFGRAGIGMGQGYAIGFPLLFGALLWDGASLVTRRRVTLPVRSFLAWLAPVAGLAAVVAGYWNLGIVGFALTPLPPIVAYWHRRYLVRMVRKGEERFLAEIGQSPRRGPKPPRSSRSTDPDRQTSGGSERPTVGG